MVCYKANMCEWYAVKQIPMDGMLLSVYQWMVCYFMIQHKPNISSSEKSDAKQ